MPTVHHLSHRSNSKCLTRCLLCAMAANGGMQIPSYSSRPPALTSLLNPRAAAQQHRGLFDEHKDDGGRHSQPKAEVADLIAINRFRRKTISFISYFDGDCSHRIANTIIMATYERIERWARCGQWACKTRCSAHVSAKGQSWGFWPAS